MSDNTGDLIKRFVGDIEWIRGALLPMDDLAKPVMGVADWDDAVCVEFGGRTLVASVDGPYAKRLVLKSALIHASTDVVVKGGRPLFALDTVIGSESEVREMIESLKKQALAMRIPILGGNTLFEDVEPRASITVVGELLLDEPIRDDGAQKGDVIALLGEPIWGEQDERIEKAKKMFDCWYEILDAGVKINSAKDVTKGGLASVVHEMQEKSSREFKLNDELPYPKGRNLDNFIVTTTEEELGGIRDLCEKSRVTLHEIGFVK